MTSRQGLQYHMNKHRGIYPYYCPYCQKGFMATSNVKYHMTEHVATQDFVCKECRGMLPDLKSLTNHLIVEHGYKRPGPDNTQLSQTHSFKK